MRVIIVVPGMPVRWRVAIAGKRFYNPAPQRKHMKLIQQYAMIAMKGRKPMRGPIVGDVLFNMPMPKSWSKAKRAEMDGQPHIIKPDLTNLRKLVEDSLSGIVYEDDQQIYCYTEESKVWALDGVTHIAYETL